MSEQSDERSFRPDSKRASVRRLQRSFTPFHRGGAGPPLVCLHGFLDTWRTWELVLPALERRHEVLALTLPGHAGAPSIEDEISDLVLADAVERAMDEAGFGTAHIAGNSLGGFVSLQLAARGRADTVVAFAPAGGWARTDGSARRLIRFQTQMQGALQAAAPYADAIVATQEGRRRASDLITTNFEHIPPDLLAHLICGAAACQDAARLTAYASEAVWELEAASIACPVRIVWGTADRVLPWPSAASRFRTEWLPHADWVELDGIGHAPQLDVPLEAVQLILGFTYG